MTVRVGRSSRRIQRKVDEGGSYYLNGRGNALAHSKVCRSETSTARLEWSSVRRPLGEKSFLNSSVVPNCGIVKRVNSSPVTNSRILGTHSLMIMNSAN